MWLGGSRHLWVQGGENGLGSGRHVVLRDWGDWLTCGGHLGSGTTGNLQGMSGH